MRERLLELVICPECKQELHIEIFSADVDGTINEGVLACIACARRYPVINGIPRLLPDSLIGNVVRYHASFFDKYKLGLPYSPNPSNDEDLKLQERTLKSFGFQWNTFREVFEEYRQHWPEFLPSSLEPSDFGGKLGLDAGCGFGRHIILTAEAGAEVIGVDLSEAVQAAYANTRHLRNVHIVQGDIYHLPFRKGTFDFIYSLGVLHHLPDPQKGFDAVIGLLNSGQEVFVWCYDNEKPRRDAIYEMVRTCTTKLGFDALYVITYLAAIFARVFLNYPAKLAKYLRLTKRNFPYQYYCKYPFRVLHANLFDVLSVPSTKYYSRQQLETWFTAKGLTIMELKHAVSGWTIYGRK